MPSFAKAKGLSRVKELLMGSRVKKLTQRAANLRARMPKLRRMATDYYRSHDMQNAGESAVGHLNRREGASLRGARVGGRLHAAASRAEGAVTSEKLKANLARAGVLGTAVGAAGAGGTAYAHHKKKTAEAFLDESIKLGLVSTEQAQRALDRLDLLEKQKPDAKKVMRYGLTGAATNVGLQTLGNVVAKKPFSVHAGGTGLRGVAGDAVKGAIGAGALPLVQAHFDRQAEMGTLKKYIAQPEV